MVSFYIVASREAPGKGPSLEILNVITYGDRTSAEIHTNVENIDRASRVVF